MVDGIPTTCEATTTPESTGVSQYQVSLLLFTAVNLLAFVWLELIAKDWLLSKADPLPYCAATVALIACVVNLFALGTVKFGDGRLVRRAFHAVLVCTCAVEFVGLALPVAAVSAAAAVIVWYLASLCASRPPGRARTLCATSLVAIVIFIGGWAFARLYPRILCPHPMTSGLAPVSGQRLLTCRFHRRLSPSGVCSR
jgi:hypothetical protein